jgi:raffinose/stachyose/melibiose transport system substrate-binding protein
MKKFMGVLLGVVLCIFLISSFAGCKSAASTTSNEAVSAETSASGTTAAETTAGVQSGEKVTIKFIHWRSENRAAWEEFIKLFEAKYPNITVDMEITTSNIDEYMTLLKTRLMANENDVFLNWIGTYVNEIDDSGYCYDFSKESFISNYLDVTIKMGTRNNRLIALNQGFNIYDIIYNKDLFEKNNITPPKNYDEYINVCKAFREKGLEPVAAGLLDNWVGELAWSPHLGGISPDVNPLIDLEAGKLKLTDEPFATMLKGVENDYNNKIYQKDSVGTGYDASLALFAQEKTPMLLAGTWALAGLDQQNPNLKQGSIVPPTYGQASVYQLMGSESACINAKSKHIPEALKFVEFMSSPEMASWMGNKVWQMPSVKNVKLDIPALSDALEAMEGLKGIDCHFTYIKYPETATILNNLAIAIIGGTPVSEAAAAAQTELDEVLASK